MRAWATLLALGFGVVGCDGSAPADALQGSWGLEQADGCVLVQEFDGANYVLGQLCQLTNGNFGFDVEDGTFQATDSQITFSPTKASCHSHSHTAEVDQYSISKGNLTISNPSLGFAVVLVKIPDSSSATGAVVLTGCWDGDLFNQSPVTPL
jgi:hypothetical protein